MTSKNHKAFSILQINSQDKGGGAETCAWILFEAFRERGYYSWLAVGSKSSKDENVWEISNAPYATNIWSKNILRLSESFSPLRQNGVPGIRWIQKYLRYVAQPNTWFQKQQGWEDFDYPGTWHLLSTLTELPDIIHCHNLHSSYFDLRALTHLSKIRPVILHLHDAWLLSGHCSHSLDCERWKIGCGNCEYLKTYPAIPQDNTAANWKRKQEIYANSPLYITTVSQWLMDKVNQSILARGHQNCSVHKKVIHNGVNTSIFKPGSQQEARAVLGLPSNAKIVLIIAHSNFKDYEIMEAALRQLTTSVHPLLFICLGRTGTNKALGEGQLNFAGWITKQEVLAQYYRAVDVYIHAALEESFGITIAEAGASGTTVVATDVGGVSEQIIDGQTGFLVPPKDPLAMTKVIQRLLEEEDLCYQMGLAAARHVQENFNQEKQVDKFLSWYMEVVEDWQKLQTDPLNPLVN